MSRSLRIFSLLLYPLLTQPAAADESPQVSNDANRPAWYHSTYHLPDFPKSDPDKAFAELKIMQPDGTPYRTAIEDWAGALERIANDPRWKSWIEARETAADQWLARTHDRVGWKAGWNHDFVSPTDGSFLVWTPEVPGEETKFFTSKTGEHVAITPKLFAAWVGTSRKKNAAMVAEVARLARLTGHADYADWAAEQLDFYTNHFDSWPVATGMGMPARLGCQSLDDAIITADLIEGARLMFDQVKPARRQAWFDKLFKPEAELLDRSYQFIHNIATWQRATQASIALLYDDTALWDRAVNGPFGLRAQLEHGVTGDYFWHEQSMTYGNFIVAATQRLLTFASLIGKKDRLEREAAIVGNLLLAPLYIRFPDGKLPNPADSNSRPAAFSTRLTETYRILPTTVGLARAGELRSWDTLLDPPPAPDRATEFPTVKSWDMESSRFALLKQGPWQVFLHYGQLARSHSQSEALNWSAFYGDTDVSHDPGTVGYGSPLHLGYYRRGINHNVPLIDGTGQVPWNPGELVSFDANAATVTAAQPFYQPHVSARRTLRIDGAVLVDEAQVELTGPRADQPARLGLSLHLQGETMLPDNFISVTPEDLARGRTQAFAHWSGIRSATFKDQASVDVSFPGGLMLTVTFETAGPFTLYIGQSLDRPPLRRAGFYLETEGKTKATFKTTLSPKQ